MSVAFVQLTEGEVRARLEGITAHLDHWGDVVPTDAGRRGPRRLLEFRFVAPGEDLPVEVTAVFREYLRRSRAASWELFKYTYEYLDRVRMRRLAYHMHSLGRTTPVVHAHCEDAADIPDEERGSHFRAVEVDLLEAHQTFMRLWASESAPDCSSLHPLAISRGP